MDYNENDYEQDFEYEDEQSGLPDTSRLNVILEDVREKLHQKPLYTVVAVFVLILFILIVITVGKNAVKKTVGEIETTVPTEISTTVPVVETTEEETTEPTISMTEAERIAQNLFDDAYDILKDGTGFANWDYPGKIKYEGISVDAYRVNMNSLEPFFTAKCLKFIGDNFTDTPNADDAVDVYGNKGSYYIFANGDSHASSFMNTIFGLTDHEKADLEIVLADNDTILAKNNMYYYGSSKSDSNLERVEYIIFKNDNGTWKIDSFEDFSCTVNTLEETTVPVTTAKTQTNTTLR